MHKFRQLTGIIISILTISCAQQTSPTGGPKDTIPPSLQYSIPKTGQTAYNKKQIELDFDELVALNNPKEQIIITPDIEKKYDVRVKKKKIIIELEKPLRDSTTYLINFRDAVQDLTEKNPTENLKLAFSTGTYIDSLSIRGSITDPLKNAPPKDAIVALYEADTFNIFKHKPTYLTKINKYGRFIIQNLKPSTYYIYAFDDKNRNLVVDSKTESYGFRTKAIDLTDEVIAEKILMVKLDSRELKLLSSRPYNSYANIKTSKGLFDYNITRQDNNDTIRSCYGEDRANIQVYNTFPDSDSTNIHLIASDSVGNRIDTTFFIKFAKKKVDKERFDLKAENTRLPYSTRTLTTTITFTKPVSTVNFDSLFIEIDSMTTIPLEPKNLTWRPEENHLTITKTIDTKYFPIEPKPETQNQATPPNKTQPWELKINKGAFISIEQDSSSSTTQTIKTIKAEDAAILLITVDKPPSSWIVELLDKSLKVVDRRANQIQVRFENLTPGDYLVRIITDTNRNGQWSPGNFNTREETENITYYLNDKKLATITLKANWELGPLLISP